MGTDFLIVGGGIGGTVLAHRLGRMGRRVLVLEKNRGGPGLVRPEILWPATVARLKSLETGDGLESAMSPLRGVTMTQHGKTLAQITPELFRSIDVQPMSTDPNMTREHLLRDGPFELRRGAEVKAILKDGDRVVGVRCRDVDTGVESEELADWTVGDDGVHSPVRDGAGIAIKTRLFPVDFLCFGFDWPAGLTQGEARFWLNREQARTGLLGIGAIPMPDGKGAGLVPTRPRLLENPVEATDVWHEFAAHDPLIATVLGDRTFPDGLVRVRRPWGHAEKYGTSGALIMGDAAHPVSPAGGQGANMSIADANTLAEVIAEGDREIASRYELRRRPANERSISITRRSAWALSMPGALLDLALAFLVWQVTRRPARFGSAIKFASTAFLE
jgi:2-polyprenyl-6-methoxyphenol hydroxylase-like FAD-dependent oxidoreductase